MELRILKYFVTIATEGTFLGAAEILHVSQSTLSRQIQTLEEEVGKTLFERSKQGVTLTESGRYLLDRAKEILTMTSQTVNTLQSNEIVTGRITVAAGENTSGQLIAAVFRTLLDQYPTIQVDLVSATADSVLYGLQHGLFDFGVVSSPQINNEYERLDLPVADRWGVVVPNNHRLATYRTVIPENLIGERLLIPRQDDVLQQVKDWAQNHFEELTINGFYDMYYSMHVQVVANVGIAITFDKPEYHEPNHKLTFIPLRSNQIIKTKLIWKRERLQTQLANQFLKEMRLLLGEC